MRRNKPTKKHARNQHPRLSAQPEKLPFIAHLFELRKRLFFVAVSMAICGAFAVNVQKQLTELLLRPAGDQQFIYTSPGGGFDFSFRICLYTAVALSIPVIAYNLLRYVQPLINKQSRKFMLYASLWSGVLACTGIAFAYFISMPSGLQFLLRGFTTDQISALISIQSYLSFVTTYLLGSAILFQLPLVLIIINRVKPLKPGKLFSYQRWVVLAAFVIGAIISPSPDIRNQVVMSGPIIFMYDASVVLIWLINRKYHRPKRVRDLLQKDAEIQAIRIANFQKAQSSWQQSIQNAMTQNSTPAAAAPAQIIVAPTKPTVVATTQQATTTSSASAQLRPRKYVEGFTRHPYRTFTA